MHELNNSISEAKTCDIARKLVKLIKLLSRELTDFDCFIVVHAF